jgi:sarcosine oxidase subunit gamma
MNALEFMRGRPAARLGLKGPRAGDWLAERLATQGVALPPAPNTWSGDPGGGLIVARLGASEFFLEAETDGAGLPDLTIEPEAAPAGVYPVLREDAAFVLSGSGSTDVLAQVCNVDFAGLALGARPVVMTLMIGVAVLVLPEAGPRFRIWCEPTLGAYLERSVGDVVRDCGGNYRGA